MHIDKPGGDGEAVGIDDLARVAADFPDGDDAPSANRNIAGVALGAGPVVDPAVFDQQVVTHDNPPLLSRFRARMKVSLYDISPFRPTLQGLYGKMRRLVMTRPSFRWGLIFTVHSEFRALSHSGVLGTRASF